MRSGGGSEEKSQHGRNIALTYIETMTREELEAALPGYLRMRDIADDLHNEALERLAGDVALPRRSSNRPRLPKLPATQDVILYDIAIAWLQARDEDLLAQQGDGGRGDAECRAAIFLPGRGEQRTGLPAA
jgi:hypothetical protein